MGKGGLEELEKGKEGINSDGMRLWVVNKQYNMQMKYYRIVHLKPI